MGDELRRRVKPTDTENQRRNKAADVLREHVEAERLREGEAQLEDGEVPQK